MAEEFEFQVRDGEALSVDEAIYQALGAASVCWEDMGQTGPFQSERAKQIGEALKRAISTHGVWLVGTDYAESEIVSVVWTEQDADQVIEDESVRPLGCRRDLPLGTRHYEIETLAVPAPVLTPGEAAEQIRAVIGSGRGAPVPLDAWDRLDRIARGLAGPDG